MKVLVIDDSALYRSAISKALEASSEITEVRTASNGKSGLEFLKTKRYDLAILDLEMPVMDGLQTLEEAQKLELKTPILVFSSLTTYGAEKTLKALEKGAVDFITKESDGGDGEAGLEHIKNKLIPKILALKPKSAVTSKPTTQRITPSRSRMSGLPPNLQNLNLEVMAIGSSTGGPDALRKIFSQITVENGAPIVLVQHMPKLFTKKLAENLDKISSYTVKEAEQGDILQSGHAYVAPGDFHMEVINKNGKKIIQLNQEEKVCYVRPAVDVLFKSLATSYSKGVLPIILTGMGRDGLAGSQTLLSKCSRALIIQDSDSSVVWGMPGAIFEKQIHSNMMNLEEIAGIINNLNS